MPNLILVGAAAIGQASGRRRFSFPSAIRGLALGLALLLAPAGALNAQSPPPPSPDKSLSIDQLVAAVVEVRTMVNPDGRTVETLGRTRQGSGVVIGSDGLILTIGYLMVEAHAAEITLSDGRTVRADVVGYDYDTGFGLLRAASQLNVRPIELGKSRDVKAGDSVLVAAAGGADMIGGAVVASKREFAGYWEYLIEDALFTSPPHPRWSGAGLIDRGGRLVGIGSLIVGDSGGGGRGGPGNMFVPIDLLGPILGELIAQGRTSERAKPWLGLTTDEHAGRLVVRRVTAGGPAEKAGIARGDVIVGVGGRGKAPESLADFYRQIWSAGDAGVSVPIEVMREGERRRIDVPSINRRTHLKLDSTF